MHPSRLRHRLLRLAAVGLIGVEMAGCDSTANMIPPIHTSGSVGNVYLIRQAGGLPRESVNQTNGTVRARSYIWQPWFIVAEAGVNALNENGSGFTAATDSQLVGGDAGLNILPLSDYPTTLSYSRTDSRSEGRIGTEFVRDQVSLTNRAAISDDFRTFLSLDRQTVDETDEGDEENNRAALSIEKGLESGALSLNLEHSDSDFRATNPNRENESETVDLVALNHSFTPSSAFSLHSSASYVRDTDTSDSNVLERVTLQGVGTAAWRPRDARYTVTGALRALNEDVELEDVSAATIADTGTSLLTGTVGVTYPIRPRLTTNFGLTGSYQESQRNTSNQPDNNGQVTEGLATSSVVYVSEQSPLDAFTWSWNANANANARYRNESDQGNEAGATSAGSIGHSLARPLEIPVLGSWQLSASQSGGLTLTNEDENDDTVVPDLSHSVSLTHSSAAGGVNTYARLSASDRREFLAEDATEFQLLQLQVNRQAAIDVETNWLAGLSLQLSRSKDRDESADLVVTANGRAAYFARDVFGVRNLDFHSELELDAIGLEEVLDAGDDEGDQDVRADWTNSLDYRIGRITASLEGSLFITDNEFGNAVIFRIRRDFDSIF